jgi:hypothetical protein
MPNKKPRSLEVRWSVQRRFSKSALDGVASRLDLQPLPSRASWDPSGAQTDEQIEQYYRNVSIGDRAAIRSTHHGWLQFKITSIDRLKPKRGRIYVAEGCSWGGSAYYAKHGKSCFAPTGQSRLVVPTHEVVDWTDQNPTGLRIPRLGA